MTPSRKDILDTGENTAVFLKTTITTYTPLLYNFVRRFGFSNEEAEDILQDVFIKVWKHENTFDYTQSSLKTWLFSITRNTIYDALRKKKNTTIVMSIDEQDDNGNNADIEDISQDIVAILERFDTKQTVLEAIDTLTVEEKSILLLHIEESMTFAEIGIIFNIPTNTIKSKHRRTLLKLQNILEHMHQNKN